MGIIEKIFSKDELIKNPPILLDIGASGDFYKGWVKIAKYSICIAFDADAREMEYIEGGKSGYRKIYVFNKIASDINLPKRNFYLTKSPYCSSTLEPDETKLKDWNFADMFSVNKMVDLDTISPQKALDELKLDRIDWFKSDSQGTDLRLFKCLRNEIKEKMIAADFEPGIIDSYKGEDKLHQLMAYMENEPFWMAELKIAGSQRINSQIKETLISKGLKPLGQKYLNLLISSSPSCGEVTYLNTLKSKTFSKRDLMLAGVIAFIKHQYGFAEEIAIEGSARFNDQIFKDLENAIIADLNKRSNIVRFKALTKKLIIKIIRI
jgi:hypothetical protein